MGNLICCLTVGNHKETIELVPLAGNVQILHKPLCAARIIQEFPQHLVCHSDSFYIGHKTPSLSPSDQLKLGNKYFLLPQHFFHSPLSLLSLASLISPPPPTKSPLTSTARLSAPLRSIERASALCQPFEIQKSDVGARLRIRVCPKFISKLLEQGWHDADERECSEGGDLGDEDNRLLNTPELRKVYAQLVNCRTQFWRPNLDSIKENDKMIGHKRFMKIKRWEEKKRRWRRTSD